MLTLSISSGYAGSQLAGSLNTAGLTLSVPSWVTAGGVGGGEITISAGTVSNSYNSIVFSNSNGLSFGLNGSTITGNYTVPTGTVYYNNTNGVSFGSSVAGSTTTISASVETNYVHNLSSSVFVQRYSLSETGGSTSGSATATIGSYLRLGAGSNITLSGGSNGITIHGGSSGTGGGVAISANGGLISSGTASFSNANNVVFGRNGQTVTASAILGISAIGDSGTDVRYNSGAVQFIGENLTVNTSVSGAKQYISYKAPALGYLYFSNTTGATWSSTYNGISTSIWLVTGTA